MSAVPDAVARSLERWHEMVASRDFADLLPLLHPDAIFRSPMAFKPYPSPEAVALVIQTVSEVFDTFTYHRRFVSQDGLSVVLEFSASVGDKELKGVDLIRFDPDGRIVEFEVMVRPFNALQTLGEEMGKRLGHLLPTFRS